MADDELTLDFTSIKKFFFKYGWIILILIPLLLSVYIRTIPLKMDIAYAWSNEGIKNNVRASIIQQVKQQYPNLPEQNLNVLVDQEYNKFVTQNKAQIEQALTGQAEALKEDFRSDNGEVYLGDIDSYYWVRYAENIDATGRIGDEYRDDVPYDDHMNAPNGYIINPNIYPYIEAYLSKILRIFNPKMSMMMVAYYTPLFLSFLAILFAFFAAKKLAGNFAGFIASLLIAVNPTILSRSLGSDNDIVNAVFPLLIMLLVFYAFDSKDLKKTAVYTALLGLIIGLYSFAWSGWWFMFLFIIVSWGVYLGYHLGYEFMIGKIDKIAKDDKIRNLAVFALVFLVFTYIGLSFFGEGHEIIKSFTNPFKIVNIKQAAKGTSIWPNVYTTVAELNSATKGQIIASLGGKLFLLLALIGSIVPLVSLDKKHFKTSLIYLGLSTAYFLALIEAVAFNTLIDYALLGLPLAAGLILSMYYNYRIDPVHSILMSIWFIATIYASTKGIRFVLLIVPAFVISFSVFLAFFVETLSKFFSKSIDIDITIPKAIFIIIALMLLWKPIEQGRATAYSYVPSVNDQWVETLQEIKVKSASDAIINSWWDFGHWFKYWADRKVTFDGASQNSQNAHWIGKVLLTDNEEQAIAILRMLDCGNTNAEKEMRIAFGGDTFKSVNMLYRLFELDEEKAREELLKITNPEQTEKIIKNMYCEPPENYFITSEDMVGKAGVWAHFGIWNFERAKIYNYFKTKEMNEFISSVSSDLGYSTDQAKKWYFELNSLSNDAEINNWIAPWPSYAGAVNCRKLDEKTRECALPVGNNQVIPLTINLTSMDAYVKVNGQTAYPNNLGYFEGEEFKLKEYSENKIGYGIVYSGDSIIYMSEQLTGSMFTRMFYLEGKGLKHFKKFYDTTDVTGARIITWNVTWPN
ncbi:MAG: hypothetical protein NDI94_03925 [Candidatus Woesearchaeota archaeon]|nr:hypothetical protein [Candidatus Woesearchaeota archaeon]